MAENQEKAIKHYNLGITYSMQGRLDDAIKEYQMAIKYKPDFAEAHYDMGVDYFQLGRLDDAIREYELALRYNPNDAKARENLLQAKSAKNGMDEYIKGCIEAVRLNPTNPLIHYNLGLAFDKKGLLDDAIREYREALRIDPNNEYARCNLGLILIRKGMLDEAVTELNEALRTNPRSITAHLGLGSTLASKGMFDHAIDEFEYVLKIDPNNADARVSLELALREIKRRRVNELPEDIKTNFENFLGGKKGIKIEIVSIHDSSPFSTILLKPDRKLSHDEGITLSSYIKAKLLCEMPKAISTLNNNEVSLLRVKSVRTIFVEGKEFQEPGWIINWKKDFVGTITFIIDWDTDRQHFLAHFSKVFIKKRERQELEFSVIKGIARAYYNMKNIEI